MCCFLELFHTYKLVIVMHVRLPDGTKVLATHTGSVKLFDNLTIDQVLYIPSFNPNLVSTSKLTKTH